MGEHRNELIPLTECSVEEERCRFFVMDVVFYDRGVKLEHPVSRAFAAIRPPAGTFLNRSEHRALEHFSLFRPLYNLSLMIYVQSD